MRFTPRSRHAWRRWLDDHHANGQEVWLVFYKRHTGKPTLTYADAVEEAICFGWIDGIKRSIDDERYSHRFTPRTRNSRWSATNRKRASRMIDAGLMAPAGAAAIATAKRLGTWESPAARVDVSIPHELADGLRRNRKAAVFFETLSTKQQQMFCGWINGARREDTRQRRIRESLDLLARGERLGMR